ncbi:MAG: glycosyltransferase family 4 protein [Flavobacterium sp.]|uniref:glycosyltransferase family 4 protein n=1 Tax=Flavobacterium sp. TaxID=239 RepID=UPI0032636409
MKILYIAPEITNSGGIARVLALKANYLTSVYNYQVTILCTKSDEETFFYDFDERIQIKTIFHSKYTFSFLNKYIVSLKKTIEKEQPDIIIICDAVLGVFLPFFLNIKTPVIFETHVTKFLKKDYKNSIMNKFKFKFIHFFKSKMLKTFDKIVFETVDGKKEWNIQNSVVIPNPISFTEQKTSKLNMKKAINISRHSHEKGIDRLLYIWKKVIQSNPDWKLDIFGHWDSNLKYQKLAIDLGISNYVNFYPPTKEVQDCYIDSSIYLMTSRSEAFGMVLIEAMYSALPCIAYDCPVGPRNIITNNINGLLVEDGNESDFINKTNLLIANENLRNQLGLAAQEDSKKYNIDSVMSIWQNLFKELT